MFKYLHYIICMFILITINLCFQNISASDNENIQYSFTNTDSTYIFHGKFFVKADPQCILNICFNYNHIKAFALDAKEVKLVQQSNKNNKIKYIYQKFSVYKNESLWYRELDSINSIIDFKLISSKNSHTYLPKVISSYGYYKVSLLDNEVLVEYHQHCKIEQKYISGFHLRMVKKKAVEFLYLFSEYIEENCRE